MQATARRLVTVLAVVAALLIGLPGAAHAAPVVVSSTTTFAGWTFSAGGAVRVRVSSASVTWYKDTLEGSGWVTAKITYKDASTDTHCARAGFLPLPDWWYNNTECNGVYKTWTRTFEGAEIRSLTIIVDRGISSESTPYKTSDNPFN
jgi:hypothetical protein